ncbi:unnamed protein product [Angiostrongylus costaricensis]|uniref:Metalloendopeptidase n=1 Tax=Angiostrongylus costaricensis TaxID=334426 RepID=A0A158PF34_ANGCS|nr:unnamed protein product [Angiostrongylus costaricensis]
MCFCLLINYFLTPKQRRRYAFQTNSLHGISLKERTFSRWKDNVVPYTLSSDYSTEQKKTIYDLLSSLEQISCFRFQQRSTEKDFLVFIPLDGCYSCVGKIGGAQVLSVDCIADYTIWHEVMHAIGFEHKHQRPDRDQFIRVEYRNVQRGQLVDFEKLSSYEVDCPDSYDYKSIMHYDSKAFGRLNPVRNVYLFMLQEGVTLNDNLKMSATDIKKLSRLGKCYSDLEHFRLQVELWSMKIYFPTILKKCVRTCQMCGTRTTYGFMTSHSQRQRKPAEYTGPLECEHHF